MQYVWRNMVGNARKRTGDCVGWFVPSETSTGWLVGEYTIHVYVWSSAQKDRGFIYAVHIQIIFKDLGESIRLRVQTVGNGNMKIFFWPPVCSFFECNYSGQSYMVQGARKTNVMMLKLEVNNLFSQNWSWKLRVFVILQGLKPSIRLIGT